MSEEPGRITRRFLTLPVREVHAFLRGKMEALGMVVHTDSIGNLRGLWNTTSKPGRRLILGSHIDTVPNAGAFDGVLGVVMAIEWVKLAQESGLRLPIEVIAFSEEEGIRFGVPFLGSRAACGRFDSSLLALKDGQGVTMEEVIRKFGLEPARIAEAEISSGHIGFVEIHIEQGPVLEAEDHSLAAVTAIAGQTRMALEFRGQANHAGTTPMSLRRDALAAAAECISAVEALAMRIGGLVATCGRIEVEPNAGNVIPGLARVSLDIRHPHDPVRFSAIEEILGKAESIAKRRNVDFSISRQLDQPAVPMDERLTAFLTEAMEAEGVPTKLMASGAGHDAMIMAMRVPTAILFLRSPGGISHHPSEAVREEDVEVALYVGRRFLERLAAEDKLT
jgi:allantoate deiminase